MTRLIDVEHDSELRERPKPKEPVPQGYGAYKLNPDLIGRRLKALLESLDLTQTEFADRCGLTQAAISQIINDNRSPSLQSLCRILEVIPVKFETLARDVASGAADE